MKRPYKIIRKNSLRPLFLMLFVFSSLFTQAQVTIRGGVYGGARQADVKGYALVEIGADKHDVLIGTVYGGNDISGTLGTAKAINAGVPAALVAANANGITDEYSAFVRICPTNTTNHIFIGNLFAGGNGDYDYSETANSDGDYEAKSMIDPTKPDEPQKVLATSKDPFVKPVLARSYLEIMGGTIAYVYGGGNNATVSEKTDIYIDNESDITTKIPSDAADDAANLLLDEETKNKIGLAQLSNDIIKRKEYHFSRVFGGNNKAEMTIQPTWHLNKGRIENLYSGGNAGDMTSPVGLLLEIDPKVNESITDSRLIEAEKKKLVIDNVYGGCRKADVHPKKNGQEVFEDDIQLADYKFPVGLSARVLVRGGDINNVYGGNDITGNVIGGNAVGIYSSIRGDVYGGGNGSYPYTDNPDLQYDQVWGDYYYNKDEVTLNEFRPNAEQVSVRIAGEANADGSEKKRVVIGGAVYVGGNSATLATTKSNSRVELKLGSYVYADEVFLGNNGANMVASTNATDVLQVMKSTDKTSDGSQYNSLDLTQKATFAEYMKGCAMTLNPHVVFDKKNDDGTGDPATYIPYTTYIGSFYCGGNVGSMIFDGANTLDFKDKIVVFDKVVGGCNNAFVEQTDYNAAYEGGILNKTETAAIQDKLILDFEGLKIQPLRWKKLRNASYEVEPDAEGNEYDLDENGNRQLEFNTIYASTGEETAPITEGENQTSNSNDLDRRLKGGNIYGGCYNSGHIDGNVVINIYESIVDRTGEFAIFDKIEENEGEAILYHNRENEEDFQIKHRRSGVILDEQGMDVLGKALNVFGGGYGYDSEIWGRTTINLNAGYAFQIFGGGEQGPIGKPDDNGDYTFKYKKNGQDYSKKFKYNADYSCYINVKGNYPGVYRSHDDDNKDMAEAEFIYGGGFFGPIAGNTRINLGNGRVFNTFAGSCNADILGHTETYVGRSGVDTSGKDIAGFPWVRDHIYGGNDLGGKILGTADFVGRVRTDQLADNNSVKDKIYRPNNTVASAYIEYQQGRVDYIFGGCYGYYNYKDRHFSEYTDAEGSAKDGFIKPRMDNAFVNFRPENVTRSAAAKIYGAGQGYSGEPDGNVMQDRSYVLIDIPQGMSNFQNMEVFGAGDYSGVGMRSGEELTGKPLSPDIAKTNADGVTASAVIDLMRGQIYAAYGASYKEGVTRRTIVNVPVGSTINVKRIFGGAYGVKNEVVCDVYEANVNYHSNDAVASGDKSVQADFKLNENTGEYDFVAGAVYGGNNSYGRTLYSKINIDAAVIEDKSTGYSSKVFGGGYGAGSWSQYTEVNLLPGASVYEVYGGGYGGRVLNKESVKRWQEILDEDLGEGKPSNLPLDIGEGYTDEGLDCYLVKKNPLGFKTNTNVNIHKGSKVWGYCYGGGYGKTATVSGTTFIGLLGGIVEKDIYGGGTSGAVMDEYGLGSDSFTATANVYIQGGTARNVYGGSWEGSVGRHDGELSADSSGDYPGKTNVVIGIRKDQASLPEDYGFYNGVPAIQRNAYGGGEGGAVFGEANLTINNAYIGYKFFENESELEADIPYTADGGGYYQEKLNDETYYEANVYKGDNRLEDCGNAYGGGYDDNSSVDFSNIYIYGGIIRNSVFGGGEIATIGRGKMRVENDAARELETIYKHGKSHIEMYKGHVLRNVYGGGKGYNKLGYGRKKKYFTDGYVFGQTEVFIRGGEIGTVEGIEENMVKGSSTVGNVFGGGDIGYVYGLGTKSDQVASPRHYYYKLPNGDWSEDCKVVVEPYAQVKSAGGVSIHGRDYAQYVYVPTDELNYLKGKDGEDKTIWDALDDSGIIIRNAVFAGGNIGVGSSDVFADATTVYGNVTASLRDIYRRDLITVGTEHTGGLYGGGNLSLVDGYRELHISNYGTDYYGLSQTIEMDEYEKLTDRERAYFRLRYTCQTAITAGTDAEGIAYKGYTQGDQIYEDEYIDLPDNFKNETYWKQDGVCSIYAGRLLNTIQRADLCGVYGSRLVLQGARDRVPSKVDKTRYTINRVGELSLKAVDSPVSGVDDANKRHGNYFGIYSLVNYLGNLTSDVLITDNRMLDKVEQSESYHDWKLANATNRTRNTATCHNEVALASGVFLELTNEPEDENDETKHYGYITGVIELDLINAKADDVGGGYVYAKNEHGKRTSSGYTMVTLSHYNDDLRTYRMYEYTHDDSDLERIQTSGNFIHDSRKTIIDDCYPHNMEYNPNPGYNDKYSEAHYWYIKGSIYVYDMEVSAYTGSPSAYSKEVHLPLTITPGSHGQLKLLNVQPNLYAYYKDANHTKMGAGDSVSVDNGLMSFHLNDVITYWDYSRLDDTEKVYFVKETVVSTSAYKLTADDENEVPAGVVMLPADYVTFKNAHPQLYDPVHEKYVGVDQIFHSSNNLGHETGYVVTLQMDTPTDWSSWYSPSSRSDGSKINTTDYESDGTDRAKYMEGPTFYTDNTGVYGQRTYTEGQIVPKSVVDSYHNPGSDDQAVVKRAYVTSEKQTYTYDGHNKTVNPGAAISETEYNWLVANNHSVGSQFKAAMTCIGTLKLDDNHYLLNGDLLNADDVASLSSTYGISVETINNCLTEAYYCEKTGLYGGTSYESGKNYTAVEGWCSLTADDRNKFNFNGDAFDVLYDPAYSGNPASYGHPYDQQYSVEYDAIYNGSSPLSYTDNTGSHTLNQNDVISREVYERYIKNEQYHYTPIRVEKNTDADFYIAKKAFTKGDVPYAKGQVISSGTYRSLSQSERTDLVKILHFTNTTSDDVFYFYCREAYNGTVSVNDYFTSGSGTSVSEGWVITKEQYATLPNDQKNFTIKGKEPTATTTLFVSRESDINDLSKDKVITVIYQYTYNESDISGENVELANELHIVNIHLMFESGAPIVGQLMPPPTVLPGTVVKMTEPSVIPGAYELIGGGWEMYEDYDDAIRNRNGVEYVNNSTPVYWYQNKRYYVSYYALSYGTGKTYSNPVPFSVANYHDISDVMADKEHHMYVDHADLALDGIRHPKIYLDQNRHEDENQLDLLKSFFDLSTGASVGGHTPLNLTQVGDSKNLDFILRSNLSHTGTWSPIGDGTHCFEGTLHGDGYTISGLDYSLFHKLCGDVYNLGVTGSFTSAGIVDTGDGYVENCWVKSSAENVDNSVKAVFGNPSDNKGVQVVNCYYPETNQYSETNHLRGNARKMEERDFYNGTVAYNLNGFYLNKRYYDGIGQSSGTPYQYLEDDPTTGSLKEVRSTGYYPVLTNDNVKYGDIGYVEDRYDNEDFIYAGGAIPQTKDVRQREIENITTGATDIVYAPIWPDDYLFFGQMLTYDYADAHPHESLPSRIFKNSGRLAQNNQSNRVYRAPAYFRSKDKSVAHFNPWAYLVAHSKPATVASTDWKNAYPDMTAIDFKGHDDASYQQGLVGKLFYQPLLDDDGLIGINTEGQTANLLAYAPASADNQKTSDVLEEYFVEPALSDYDETSGFYDDGKTYKRIAVASTTGIHGHLVMSDKTAANDHLLVDGNDFNCPIDYKMGNAYRMWYQRTPDRFIDQSKGWDAVSLPFTVELVTTQDKGEITHFYNGSTKGHEYWLRQYDGIDNTVTLPEGELAAKFNYANEETATKTFTNTFLWDYYYSKDDYDDRNKDKYQNTYYKADGSGVVETYHDYPLAKAGTPYLIGFPGATYYEFDLSGQWTPQNRYNGVTIANPGPQTISFVSKENMTIGVSDDEIGTTDDGYTFRANYLNNPSTDGKTVYLLDGNGDSFDKKVPDGVRDIRAFRPYFVNPADASASPTRSEGAATKENPTRSIVINTEMDDLGTTTAIREIGVDDDLLVNGGRKKITVESQLHYTTDVRIVTPAGITLTTYSIQPSEYVETRVETAGVYIVYADNGKYVKKVIVR